MTTTNLAGFADADTFTASLTREQRLLVADAIWRRGHQDLADMVCEGLGDALPAVAAVAFTTEMQENGSYNLNADNTTVYYTDPSRDPDSFDFGYDASQLVAQLHGQVNHQAWLGMVPSTGAWCLHSETPLTADLSSWPIEWPEGHPPGRQDRRPVCRCLCGPHRGRPGRDDFNDPDCRCTVDCAVLPPMLVVPQWGTVLFIHPFTSQVWGVDWCDGHLDWYNASAFDDVADRYEAAVAVGGLLPAIARLVDTHEVMVNLT